MTNQHQRKVYLRKSGKKYLFECKIKGKTVYLFTICKPYDKFIKKLCKSLFFPKDKANKILTLLASSDYKDIYPPKKPKKLRIMENTRTFENDDIDDLIPEQYKNEKP